MAYAESYAPAVRTGDGQVSPIHAYKRGNRRGAVVAPCMSGQTQNMTDKIEKIRVRLRLDIKENKRKTRLSRSSVEKRVGYRRDEQVISLQYNAFQGVEIEDIDSSGDVYLVDDQQTKTETAYAPLTIVMKITSLHDALPFIIRDDFRKIEVLEPADYWVNGREIETLFFRMSEEFVKHRQYMEDQLKKKR
ncbi:MAG: hypothetical protein M0Z41_21185 [Peptococcaceae bacterium]|nr:hypothetical protein [Peptococcaceae bacterium]